MSFNRKTLATLLVALVVGSTMAGFGIYLLNAPAQSISPPDNGRGGFTTDTIALNTGYGGTTCVDVTHCSINIAVKQYSVLLIAIDKFGTGGTYTVAVHGYVETELEGSANTAPVGRIYGNVINSTGTVTAYANFSAAEYYTLEVADFSNVSNLQGGKFVSGVGTSSGSTTAGTCSVTTTVANEVAVSLFGVLTTAEATMAPGGGGTQLNLEATTTSVVTGEDQYVSDPSTGAFASTNTLATAATWRSVCVGLLPAVVPTAPTALTASGATTTTIPLTWTDTANQVSHLVAGEVSQASYSGGCGSYTPSYAASSPYNSYTVTGLTIGTEYCFQVTVSNSTGASGDSAFLATSTVAGAPTALSVTSTTASTIVWGWTNPAGALTDDYLYWQVGSACSSATKIDIGSVVTTYTLTGLSGDTQYCAYVEAVTLGGAGAASSTVSGTTLPGAPTGLSETSATTSQIVWGWTNPSGTLTDDKFFWQKGTACSSATLVDIGSVATSYTLTGLSIGTEYCAYVEAVAASGTSLASSTATGWTIPAAPTALSVNTETASSITWQWTNPATTLTDVYIYWQAGTACSSATKIDIGSNVTSYDLTGLSGATQYCAYVEAVNAGGSSAASSTATGWTLPGAPTSLSVSSSTSSTIVWTWTNPSGTLSDDYLYWQAGTTCSSATKIDIGSVVTTYTLTGLSGATEYCAYVEAVSSGGASAASSTVTGWTLPSAPTALSQTAATTTTITWGWTNPSGTLTDDYLYWQSGTACNSATKIDIGSVVTSYQLTGLTAATEYCAYVEAVSSGGASTASSTVDGWTVPNAPTSLAFSTSTTTTITWTWTNPSGTLSDDYLYWQSGTACTSATKIDIGSVVTTYQLTGLAAGTEYCAYVEAVTPGGPSAASSTITGWTLPAAPTALSVSTETASSITYTWSNPGTTLTDSYLYWKAGSSCVGAAQVNIGSVVATYTLGSLSGATEYCAYVEAVNAGGPSAASSSVTGWTLPGAPTGLSVSTETTTTITWTWSNPSGTLTDSYFFWEAGSSCSSPTMIDLGSVVTSHQLTGLSSATEYCAYVQAVDASGASASSSTVTGWTLPTAPTSLSATSSTTNHIVWGWTNPSGTLTDSYLFWEAGSSCSSPTMVDIGSVVTTYTLTGLSSATEYCAYVQAVDSAGASASSSTATGWTLPSAPTALSVTGETTTTISISWSNPSGTLTDSYVYVGTACVTANQIDLGSVMTSYTITGLSSATSYCIYVQAVGSGGPSASSSTVTGWTLPTAPTSLSATAETTTSITWGWTNPSGTLSDSYLFWEAGSSCSSPTMVDIGSVSVSYVLTGLTPNTLYCAYVQAEDTGGPSASSNTATGTTMQTIPSAPTNLISTNILTTELDVAWTNPGSPPALVNATIYYGASATCAGTTVGVSIGVVSSYAIPNLMAGTQYSIEVTVWSSGGQSPDSNCLTESTLSGAAPAPTDLVSNAQGDTWITINWVNPSSSFVPVNNTVYIGPQSGTWTMAFSTSGAATQFNISGLTPGTTYFIAVTVWSPQSADSNVISVATLGGNGGGGGGNGNNGGGGTGSHNYLAQLDPAAPSYLWVYIGVAVLAVGVVVLFFLRPWWSFIIIGAGGALLVVAMAGLYNWG